MRNGVIGALAATAVAACAALGFFWLKSPRATPVGVGARLPAVELSYAAAPASRVRLDQLRGNPVLLIFVELQSDGGRNFAKGIERLHRKHRRFGLNQVAIALDDNVDALREALGREAITYDVLSDPGAGATTPAFGRSQPGDTYLVDADGVVQRVWVTAEDWSDDRVSLAVDQARKPSR